MQYSSPRFHVRWMISESRVKGIHRPASKMSLKEKERKLAEQKIQKRVFLSTVHFSRYKPLSSLQQKLLHKDPATVSNSLYL